MFNEESPAQRYFGDPALPYGGFGENEETVGTLEGGRFARRRSTTSPRRGNTDAAGRGSRVAVMLFGIGGFSLLVAPILTANYDGRYTVPIAGLMMAAAAIAIVELRRRLAGTGGPVGDATATAPAAQT